MKKDQQKNPIPLSPDDETEKRVKEITNNIVLSFLQLNPDSIDQMSFNNMERQAKMGCTFTRDREMMKRIINGQEIRVITQISADKDELKDLLKRSLPDLRATQ